MNQVIYFFIIAILPFSDIVRCETRLFIKDNKIDQVNRKSYINLSIESSENIYGIKFDIHYDYSQIIVDENKIISMTLDAKIYKSSIGEGITRLLILGNEGGKLLDVSSDYIDDLIQIHFKPISKFRDTSIVIINELVVAGKSGKEIGVHSASNDTFIVSFLIPQVTSLSKNFPNPFETVTSIDYALSESNLISLIIYNMQGILVRTLVEGYQEANYYTISWDGVDSHGKYVASGRYLLKMTTPNFSDSITLIIIK